MKFRKEKFLSLVQKRLRSQNHRMVKAGQDLQRLSGPTSLYTSSTALTRSTLILNFTACSSSFPDRSFCIWFQGSYPHVTDHLPFSIRSPITAFISQHEFLKTTFMFSTTPSAPVNISQNSSVWLFKSRLKTSTAVMPFHKLKNGSMCGAETTCITIPSSTDFSVCIPLLPFGLYLHCSEAAVVFSCCRHAAYLASLR